MMNYDDRFDFPKFELPNVWLTFTKGGGGTFKNADGKMRLAPGHSLAKKFPDKVATKAEMEERAAKAKGEKVAGGGGSLSKMIDDASESLSVAGVSSSDIAALKRLSTKSTPQELEDALLSFQIIDNTFLDYSNSWRAVKGTTPPSWNESARQLRKISDMDDVDDIKAKVSSVSTFSKNAGKSLREVDPAVAAHAGKSSTFPSKYRKDPMEFYRKQGEFYQTKMPAIAKQLGDIRIAQLEQQQKAQAKSASSRSRTTTKDAQEDEFAAMF